MSGIQLPAECLVYPFLRLNGDKNQQLYLKNFLVLLLHFYHRVGDLLGSVVQSFQQGIGLRLNGVQIHSEEKKKKHKSCHVSVDVLSTN